MCDASSNKTFKTVCLISLNLNYDYHCIFEVIGKGLMESQRLYFCKLFTGEWYLNCFRMVSLSSSLGCDFRWICLYITPWFFLSRVHYLIAAMSCSKFEWLKLLNQVVVFVIKVLVLKKIIFCPMLLKAVIGFSKNACT